MSRSPGRIAVKRQYNNVILLLVNVKALFTAIPGNGVVYKSTPVIAVLVGVVVQLLIPAPRHAIRQGVFRAGHIHATVPLPALKSRVVAEEVGVSEEAGEVAPRHRRVIPITGDSGVLVPVLWLPDFVRTSVEPNRLFPAPAPSMPGR